MALIADLPPGLSVSTSTGRLNRLGGGTLNPRLQFLMWEVWGGALRIGISHKLPGDAEAAGLGTPL